MLLAIAFVINHPAVTSAIIGPRTMEQLDSQLPAADVILDLSSVSFIDSSALGVIVQAEQRLGRQGRGLAVIAPEGSAAAQLVEITKVDRSLRVAATLRNRVLHGRTETGG